MDETTNIPRLTAHQLAHQLLLFPDLPVAVRVASEGWYRTAFNVNGDQVEDGAVILELGPEWDSREHL